ncbi:unnamed protein product [Caenorhabditis brenneri]
MSLSRPARFPLLKLPWLCIKCVLHNSDEFILIYFATISDRTRRIVRSSSYPIREIDVCLSRCSYISFKHQLEKTENEKTWYFIHDTFPYVGQFVLRLGSLPIRSSRGFNFTTGNYLDSYTAGNKLDALKMGIEFMIDVFRCSIKQVSVDGNKLSDFFGLGISTVKELLINDPGPVNITDLKYLLKNVKVTDEYVFCAPIAEDFSCDPQIFNCRRIAFLCNHSADWVTLEILRQFDASQLYFSYHYRFSKQDIVSYVTHWFNSENKKLEYLHINFKSPVSLVDFKIDHLNPMPFCETRRNRYPFVKGWEEEDMSSGMDILRQDGLLATLFAKHTYVIFYVWHKRFPDVVQI